MSKVKALVFLTVIVLLSVSSWLMSRKARRMLGESLGRQIRNGEETSLRAWMSVPDATLRQAQAELSGNVAERALETLESVNHLHRAGFRRQREHEPGSEHLSIR
jgi:hypothetical protein